VPIVTGGLLYLLLGIFLIVFMTETGFQPHQRGENEKAGLPAMLSTFREGAGVVRGRPILLMLVAVSFFVGTASEGFDRLGDAHLVENFVFPSLGTLQPVVWFSILALSGSLFSLATTELFRRRIEAASRNPAAAARALLVLNLLSIAAVISFALSGNFFWAFASLMVRSATGALIYPLYEAFLVQNTASRVRATILSMTGQSNALGQIIGGPGVGWIGSVFSLRAALVTTGLLFTPISVIYARAIHSGSLTPESAGPAPADPLAVEAD
jgi:hypothetical protein